MNRRIYFTNEKIYHVFNRGVDKRDVFLSTHHYKRALITLDYYRFANLPLSLSRFLELDTNNQERILSKRSQELVEILAYCLMPNHFHFILKQVLPNGISNFISNFSNSYSKYFNTKNERTGHLLQGRFKAAAVETSEQLAHLSRYIHLNPFEASIVDIPHLLDYRWSSYPEYLGRSKKKIAKVGEVLSQFRTIRQYEKFVLDHASYLYSIEEMEGLDFPQFKAK